MSKKFRNWLFVVLSTLVVIVFVDLIVKKPFFGSARDRVLEILHRDMKISAGKDSIGIANRDFLKKYYDFFGYRKNFTDTSKENDKYRDMLVAMLNYADSLGLDRKDYHQDYIARYDSLSHKPNFDNEQYEGENELIFTDAALTFLYNVAYGREINISFNGVKYNIDSTRILNTFNALLNDRNWRRTLDSLEPRISQYTTLKQELNRMGTFVRNHPSADSSKVTVNDNAVLVDKLRAYGLLPELILADSVSLTTLTKAVKVFQKMMSVDTTGKLDDKTLAYLNFPLSSRVQQIKESLNYWRWTGRLKEKEFILVNIPAARLQIVNSDSTHDIAMKVIVGKQSTQTPQFTAYINKVTTYPYWVVPLSIATKEMLPKIKKSVNYLEQNNLQVLNNKGVEVDPEQINWKNYSQKYFPFTLRQSTGCDNSLGVLKFDLNSPFSIYLHDTNAKGLFGKKDRFLSHGCIRVEKPMVLAEFVLRNQFDTTTIARLNKCLGDQKPEDFPLKKRFPVLILYMTADVDETGALKFYNDVYGKESKPAKPAAI